MTDRIYVSQACFYTKEEIDAMWAQIPAIGGSEIIIGSTAYSDAARETMLELFNVRKFKPWFDPNVIYVNFKVRNE